VLIAMPLPLRMYRMRMEICDRLIVLNIELVERNMMRLRATKTEKGQEERGRRRTRSDHGGKNEDIYSVKCIFLDVGQQRGARGHDGY
jgi:hypothetical protein